MKFLAPVEQLCIRTPDQTVYGWPCNFSFHDELPPVLPGRSISKEHINTSNNNLSTSTKNNHHHAVVLKKAGAPPPLNLVSMKGPPSTNNHNKLQPRTTRTATLRKLKLRNSVMNMPSPMTAVPTMAKRAQSTSNLLIDQNNTTKYKQKK